VVFHVAERVNHQYPHYEQLNNSEKMTEKMQSSPTVTATTSHNYKVCYSSRLLQEIMKAKCHIQMHKERG